MDKQNTPLSHLPINKKAKITSIQGGHGFQRKLCVMGIREKQEIKIISRQPFRGPLTIEVCGSQMTLGRGMAQNIMVEVIQ
jgi:ferrous iron transport protein A